MGRIARVAVVALVAVTLAGCSAGAAQAKKHATPSDSPAASAPAGSATPSGDASGATAQPTFPAGTPDAAQAPDPARSHLATPEPAASALPSPTLTPVAAGTVVAQGDVASPKGSIHFHYRVVANGDNTYAVQYSGFTSTVPVPVSATLIDIPPRVGDGLTWHGVGDQLLGGPTNPRARRPLRSARSGSPRTSRRSSPTRPWRPRTACPSSSARTRCSPSTRSTGTSRCANRTCTLPITALASSPPAR